jgi:selenocysteine lyase/cysteine desulfurase
MQIDALVCASYKWLMGPYQTALSYIHPRFNEGVPLEESWMTRPGAERFDRLTEYVEGYRPGAARFDVGQSSSFIHMPMLAEGLRQLMDWGVENIQEYARNISDPLIDLFRERGVAVDDEACRAHHLVGLALPEGIDGENLVAELQQRKVFVSLRGSNIRISFNVFNDEADVQELIEAL